MGLLGNFYYAACRTRAGHRFVRAAVRAMRSQSARSRFRMPFDALALDHPAVAGLMKLWSRIHWSDGDGMMPAEQLLAVYRLAASWPVEGDSVELGSWSGLTTSYLAMACRVRGSGRVFAVDTFQGTKEGGAHYPSVQRYGGSTFRAFQERIERAGVADLVVPMVGLTTEMAPQYSGRPIRLILIDADHSYDGVKKDFSLWSPHMAPGGLILFHDYSLPEVARFVDEVVADGSGIIGEPGEVVPNLFAVTIRRDAARIEATDRPAPSPAFASCGGSWR